MTHVITFLIGIIFGALCLILVLLRRENKIANNNKDKKTLLRRM